jgi:hypothetical protein
MILQSNMTKFLWITCCGLGEPYSSDFGPYSPTVTDAMWGIDYVGNIAFPALRNEG